MTIKQLADELGVSKPTVSKAIKKLGVIPVKVGNRSEISDEDTALIAAEIAQKMRKSESPKSQISQKSETVELEKTPKSEKSQTHESQKTQISQKSETVESKKTEKSQTSPNIAQNTEDKLIELLEKQLSVLQEQLEAKDRQLYEKDKQLELLSDALKTSQEQQAALVTALTAEQALHAGTIQKGLTDHSAAPESVSAEPADKPSPTGEKRSFLSRLFGKK